MTILLIGPLVLPLLAAFKAPGEAVFGADSTLLPQRWSLDAFGTLFRVSNIGRSMLNSLIVCILGVSSHIVLSCLGGYMLSRKGWRGRNVMTIIVTSAMIFPFESLMLTLFNMIAKIGLYGSLLGVWLPTIIGPFQILLMRAAFLGIPDAVEDAAYIDGAGEVRRFWSIFLPQVRGAITVVGLTSFISYWSDYLWPLVVLPTNDTQTMMLSLASLKSSINGTSYQLVLAGAVVALVPVVLLFVFTQRYFFRGIEAGGLKF